MFSVIIPTFNNHSSLQKSICSVLRQTFQDFEIIIVDNGSTDETMALVEKIQKENKKHKITYFFQNNSGSPAGSRNTGIKNSKKDWICFLDADDYWLPTKLEEIRKCLLTITLDVVAIGHWEYIETPNKKLKLKRLGQKKVFNQYKDLLFNGNSYSTSAMTVKRSSLCLLGGFNVSPNFFGVEDYLMWLSLTRKGKIITIKKPLSVFCVHESNFSQDIITLYRNEKSILKHEIKTRFSGSHFLLKKHFARVDYYIGRALQKKGERSSIPILLASIKAYPFFWKKYVSLTFALIGIKL